MIKGCEMLDPLDFDYQSGEFEIVQDATAQEDGGFRPGSHFKKDHLRWMLRQGDLADGTIIKHIKTGKLFRVQL